MMETRHLVYAGLAVGAIALAWWLFREETPQEATQRRQQELFNDSMSSAALNVAVVSFIHRSREQPA